MCGRCECARIVVDDVKRSLAEGEEVGDPDHGLVFAQAVFFQVLLVKMRKNG
jgi:hypothetical protein